MSMSEKTAHKPVGVLERGLILLGCFSQEHSSLRLREFTEITSFNKSTILRALTVLQNYNFIAQNADGSYSPNFELERLGLLYRQNYPFMERVQNILNFISAEINESAAFYISEKNLRICVAICNAKRSIQHNFYIGTQIKLSDGGSAGHIISYFTNKKTQMADEISKQGYAFTVSERESEQASLSIALFDLEHQFLGAVVVAGLHSRFNEKYRLKIIETTKNIIKDKGFNSSI